MTTTSRRYIYTHTVHTVHALLNPSAAHHASPEPAILRSTVTSSCLTYSTPHASSAAVSDCSVTALPANACTTSVSLPSSCARILSSTWSKSDRGKLAGCSSMNWYEYSSASVRTKLRLNTFTTAPA